jgi:hypothetical protein
MNWRNNFLGQLLGGDHLKDYQHAARLYTDDLFRLAPKSQFLYHVVFDINPAAVGSTLSSTTKLELGMIVKRCDLPQYQFNVEMKNSYNYKNYVTTGITYQPVVIVLHDDMGDVATSFFKSYYQNYYADTLHAEVDFQKANFNDDFATNGRWGRDIGTYDKFFNSISIFQMNRQRFTEYKMMNPVINDFNNGSLDQTAGNGINEQQFSISYSGVLINAGSVSRDNPQGFATFHYDKSPSPNKGGGDSLFGILGGASSALGAFGQGNILGGVLAGAQVYDKIRSGRGIKGIKEEIIGVAKDAVKISQNNLGATSKPGIRFPQNERTKRIDATLVRTNTALQPTSSNNKPIATENINDQLAQQDGSIKLTPQQIKSYLNLDTVAKTKFAKFVTFRSEKNLDIENVETEWKKLTTAEQTSYENKAVDNAVKLSEGGIINYAVDKEVYDRVIKSQAIS